MLGAEKILLLLIRKRPLSTNSTLPKYYYEINLRFIEVESGLISSAGNGKNEDIQLAVKESIAMLLNEPYDPFEDGYFAVKIGTKWRNKYISSSVLGTDIIKRDKIDIFAGFDFHIADVLHLELSIGGGLGKGNLIELNPSFMFGFGYLIYIGFKPDIKFIFGIDTNFVMSSTKENNLEESYNKIALYFPLGLYWKPSSNSTVGFFIDYVGIMTIIDGSNSINSTRFVEMGLLPNIKLRYFATEHFGLSIGFGYRLLFALEHVGKWNNGWHVFGKVTFSASMMGLATWVGATRLSDNRHHIEDVIVGGIIGATSSFLFYAYQNEWFFKHYDRKKEKEKTINLNITPMSVVLLVNY